VVTPRVYAKNCNPQTLTQQIIAAGILQNPTVGFKFYGVSVDPSGPTTTVWVIDTLSGADGTTIDNTVTAHVFTPDDSDQVTTTGATPTTIETIPLQAGFLTKITVEILFRQSGVFAGGIQRKVALFSNNTGVLTQIGATATELSILSLSITGVSFAISGTNVLVQVTGLAATTFIWKLVSMKVDVSI
jgi:hypothetical protein